MQISVSATSSTWVSEGERGDSIRKKPLACSGALPGDMTGRERSGHSFRCRAGSAGTERSTGAINDYESD